MNLRPVFIGGCDRSGTTLLGDILGATSWSFVTPESQFFHEMLFRLKLGAFDDDHAAASWLHNQFRFASWDLELSIEQLTKLINIDNPRSSFDGIVEHYLQQKHPDKSHADVWIDHTPDNFKYHSSLKALYPEARFIHIVRDGRAVSHSLKDLEWGPNNAYSASRHWADRLLQALNVEVAENDNCFRLSFEQLVTEPDKVLPQLCAFIGIPYEPEMINGGGLQIPSFTSKQHSLVGTSPKKQQADAWRKKTTPQDLRDFESYPLSRLLLEKMGYSLEHSKLPKLSRTRILNRYLHEFIYNMLHRMRHRKMESDVINNYQKKYYKNMRKKFTNNQKIVNPC